MSDILIVGFPKSGNTWLSRLLSDALDWTVTGTHGAVPLAAQTKAHDDSVIRQLHLSPKSLNGSPAIIDQHTFNTTAYTDQKIVHIIRDPRDVAVSIHHYWGREDFKETLRDVLGRGAHPLWGCSWAQYVTAWRAVNIPVIETRYEWLQEDTALELARLIDQMNLRAIGPLNAVIAQNEIETKRQWLKEHDENLPHGLGPQLTNLRAGRVGDWRNWFDFSDALWAAQYLNDQLLALGYESDRDWYLRYQVPDSFVAEMAARFCQQFDDPLHNPRLVKSLGLYQLAGMIRAGSLVELGTYHGNGAVSLASHSHGRTVYTIDDYADYTGWMGEHYGAPEREIMQHHLNDLNLPIEWIEKESHQAAQTWDKPIGLLYWDIGGADRLCADFEAWQSHVMRGGLFVIHDTLDRNFKSDELIEGAIQSGQWAAGPQLPMLYTLVKQ